MLNSARLRLESGLHAVMETAESLTHSFSPPPPTQAHDPDAPEVSAKRRRSVYGESGLDPATAKAVPSHPKCPAEEEQIRGTLQSLFLFRRLSEEAKTRLVEALVKAEMPAETEVIRIGAEPSPTDCLYIIKEGTLEALDAHGRVLKRYNGSGYFGELSLLHNENRAATVVSRSAVVLWALDRLSYQIIVRKLALDQRLRHKGFLGRVELLSELSDYEREHLSDALYEVSVSAGEVVMRQGEPGDHMFFVRSGSLSVWKDGIRLPGDVGSDGFVGEQALTGDNLRLATVVADAPSILVRLDKEAFDRLLSTHLIDKIAAKAEEYKTQDMEVAE